jgi:pimeloyl-ACP methyl ester carboxylesterase
MRSSDYGWTDDVLAFCSPWGFDPAAVTVPVLLWHGANDVFSPASHARWLADRIPTATVIVQAGAAHFGALDVLPDILRWLSSSLPVHDRAWDLTGARRLRSAAAPGPG